MKQQLTDTTIYLIQARERCYEPLEWIVCFYFNEQEAEQHVANAKQWNDDYKKKNPTHYRRLIGVNNPYDPGLPRDILTADYEVVEVSSAEKEGIT